MQRTLKFALTVVLGAGLILPATAQNFPDVPNAHWAYDALENLRGSVLFGYPDGLYRGNRPTTRYEMAAALNALYQRMMGVSDGLQGQIDALKRQIDGMPGGVGNTDDLRNMLQALQADVNSMKSWQNDINTFKRMAAEYEAELAALGVNIDKLNANVASLDERLRKLEEGGGGMINVGGDANLLVLAGHSTDGEFGLTQDGRLTGFSSLGTPVGIDRDFSVLHELGLNLSGNVDEGVGFNATLVGGDTLNGLGHLNRQNRGVPFQGSAANSFDMYIYNLEVNFNTALAGQGFNATVGRTSHSVGLPVDEGDVQPQSRSNFLWKRSDYTPYYQNERWDNGEYVFDGAKLGFNFGGAEVWLFGGRNSNLQTTGGTDLNPISLAFGNPNAMVDTTLGIQALFGLGDNGNLNLAYILHDSNANPTTNGGINRLSVYGAQADFDLGPVTVGGSFSQSVAGAGTNSVIDNDNSAWEAWGGFENDQFRLVGGYRSVDTAFLAAGSWDRLGTMWSPRNVEGFFADLTFMPTSQLEVFAKGQFMEGKQNNNILLSTPVGTQDDVTAFTVGVDYQVSEGFGFMASYEDVRWNFQNGTDPNQRWFNVGFNYELGANSNVMVTYMYSDVDFKGRQGAFGFANTRYRGGLIGTQVSVRF